MDVKLDIEVPECLLVLEDQASELGCTVGIVTNGRGLWGVRINGTYVSSLGPPEYVAEACRGFLAKGFYKESALLELGLMYVVGGMLKDIGS